MIEAIRRLGEEILKDLPKEGINRKKAILDCLTNEIRETYNVKNGKDENKKDLWKSKPIFEVIINLDIEKDKIEIKRGEDLRKSNRYKYFNFSPSSSRGGKISFSNNLYKYHLANTIPDLIKFIEENLKEKSKFEEFLKYLNKIKEQFYVKNDTKLNLDFNKIQNYDLELTFEDNIEKIFGISQKEFKDNFRVFNLYINGNSILDSDYKDDYINIKFLELIDKYFNDNWKKSKTIKENKITHLDGKKNKITKEISILTKFYITDKAKPVFFENFDVNNSYKAFTSSKEDYICILLGIRYIWEKLRFKIQNLDVLLIPKSSLFFNDINLYSSIIRTELNLLNKKNGYNNENEKINILETLNKNSLIFDLLFYEKGQNDFNIFKIISSLSLRNIKHIQNAMKKVFDNNKNTSFKENVNKIKTTYLNEVSLNTIWNSLYFYLIKKSGRDNKIKLYRTDFFTYLDAIFNQWKINEQNYIKSSIKNLKCGYHMKFKNNEKENITKNIELNRLNNQILNIFNSIQFFEEYNLIKYKRMENKKEIMIKDIGVKKLEDFFELHKSKFALNVKNGCEKQGLIILGYLINKIVYAQKEKSKTFIDKINFDGIKPNKIMKLLNDVEEYLDFYKKKSDKKIFLENNILSACYERLEYIKESSLKPEEITYYILFGNSLGAYISRESAQNRKDSNNEPDKKENNKNDN